MKISIYLLNTDLTTLINGLWDLVENKLLKDKFKNVTKIKLDSLSKPRDE
jgi:hypothetical protein